MTNAASNLGVLLSENDFRKLIAQAELSAKNAGSMNAKPTLACDPSCISVSSKLDQKNTTILGVDVGGTHVQCGLRHVDNNGIVSWSELADISNNSLKGGQHEGILLQQMTTELARRLGEKMDERGIAKDSIAGIGVVWSNQLNSTLLDPASSQGTSGVTGIVAGKGAGTAYRKGEWWNDDLRDGHDIGTMFIESFRKAGLKPKSFVIGNDTIFTCKALSGADAGMVASTGANVTIIPAGSTELCNSEAGGFFEVPSSCLANLCSPGHSIIKLEDAMAGVGMPGLFVEYLRTIASKENVALKDVGDFLDKLPIEKRWNYFIGQDISAILDGNFDFFLRGKDKIFNSPEAKEELAAIAAEFARTGGRFAAVMAYISICNQLPDKDEFVIALDSSQSRFIRGYFDSMKKTLGAVLAEKGKKVHIELLVPQGEIAVPMLGVARAVNDFLG